MIRTTIALTALAFTAQARNLLQNSSFEKATDQGVVKWEWHPGEADATCVSDIAVSRSGKAALRLTNRSPKKPNIFGCLTQTVDVRADCTYTLSCYVKTEGAGTAWIGGGRTWEHRFALPRQTEGWQRVTGSFTTRNGERSFTVRIVTESPTAAIWIDDVSLEAGSHATPYVYSPPLAPGQSLLTLHPVDPRQNLVTNASFEAVGEGVPAGWLWDRRNTDAALSIDRENVCHGKAAVKITNTTKYGPHVYSSLHLARAVDLKPGVSYSLSAWIKTGDASSGSWIGGGENWRVRRPVPVSEGKWERITHTFVAGENEKKFHFMIVTSRPGTLWIDDIALREGVRPLPSTFNAATPGTSLVIRPAREPEVLYQARPLETRWATERWPRDSWVFCDEEFVAEGFLQTDTLTEDSRAVVTLSSVGGEILCSEAQVLAAGTSAAFISLRYALKKHTPGEMRLSAEFLSGDQTKCGDSRTFQLISPERVLSKIEPVTRLRDTLDANVQALTASGRDAESRVTLRILNSFIPWVQSDVTDGQIDRAWDTVVLLEQMGERETVRSTAILAGGEKGFSVPRYTAGPLEISGAQTIGNRRFPDGTVERGPVFFTGYGHFNQLKNDVELLPAYGCNMMQVGFGPREILATEDLYRERVVTDFIALCDRARNSGVAVNLLLSPHYFPAWALEKWPDLRTCYGGFLQYCVYDLRARGVIEKAFRALIPRIKDHPAIHSLCLSNEPVFTDLTRCSIMAERWPRWLAERHGTIEILNRRWKTAYSHFEEIPIPEPEFQATPLCLEFIRFNQECFAEFHQWMADLVHSMAPEIPVHSKIMMARHFEKRISGFWSVSPELFARLSQYNGNDSHNLYLQDDPLWNNQWLHSQMEYDFQRSMKDMPIYNSENHVIEDRDHHAIPPGHLYSVIWQQAVHGQNSTTLWVWERTNEPVSGFTGSILHRPDCVEAVGRCNLDLNRLAYEIAAIQNIPPVITLLWSPSSMVLGDNHERALKSFYEASNFLGYPLGFATERKLAKLARDKIAPRPLDSTRVFVLPGVSHLPDDARRGIELLRSAGAHIVYYGCRPEMNDWNEKLDCPQERLIEASDNSRLLFEELLEVSNDWHLPPTPLPVDQSGKPVFGVEIRSAPYKEGHVVSLCNHLRHPLTIRLLGNEDSAPTDLVVEKTLSPSFEIRPLEPRLIQIR